MKLKVKNNKKKLKAPKLRFPEFTDDWEECELGKFGKTFTGLSGKTKDDFGHGEAKFVTYLNVFNNSISDPNGTESIEIDDKQNQVKYGDIFFTTSSETAEEVGMSSIWLDNSKNIYLNSFCFGYRPTVEFDPYYLAFMLRSPSIRKKFIFLAQGISRYNISKIKVMKMKIPVTSLIEQKKIGKFFKEIDQLIALNQNKISHIKDLKAGFLQKMFPKNGETKPEIRFDGFTDDWEECLMENLVTQVVREVSKPKEPYKRVSVRSHAKGTFQQKVEDASKISMSKLFIVKKNDLIVNITFAWEHAIAVATDKDDGLLVSHRFPTYRSEGKSDINFIHYLVSKEEFRKKMDLISPGGAGRNRVLNKKEFLKISSFVPELSEQQKIGEFFSQLDNLLTLYQRKLEHLQEQKKSLLKQMFI